MKTKPPLGIMPKRIYQEQRFDVISEALIRFIACTTVKIPVTWIEEYNELIEELTPDEPIKPIGKA